MATPEGKNFAAALYDFAGRTIRKLVLDSVPVDQKILDIGAGWAKYKILLWDYKMDAVEVWKKYVTDLNLEGIYETVYIMEAVQFEYPHRYGAVILGDVLEHMSVEDAQKVIKAACVNADHVFVAVPFEMPQHEEDGNPYEEHIQDDLTKELMAQRYPELAFYDISQNQDQHAKAIYIKA